MLIRILIKDMQSIIVNVQSIISVPECCCLGVPATTTRQKCQAPVIKRHKPPNNTQEPPILPHPRSRCQPPAP
jgi:hypothetical protein